MQLVLSLFSGVGLLDKAFKEAGFCVVSAGDLITGQDIRDFKGIADRFDGIIGGSPCPDFSKLKRDRPEVKDSYGFMMIKEFERIVLECNPSWWLLENVAGVPELLIDGFGHQRIDINQSWYEDVSRLRHIQFGHKDDLTIHIDKNVTDRSRIIEGCAVANDRRTFKELVRLQGLPEGYDLPSFNVEGKKRAVGNGVPLVMGRVLANAVKSVTHLDKKSIVKCDLAAEKITVTDLCKKCGCGCGRSLIGRQKYYDFTCRKRAQRKREKAA